MLERAVVARHAEKATREDPAPEEGAELPFDEVGQPHRATERFRVSREVKRFTSGRVFALTGSFGLSQASAKTPRKSLCCKRLRALVGLLVAGRRRSSNLRPSAHRTLK